MFKWFPSLWIKYFHLRYSRTKQQSESELRSTVNRFYISKHLYRKKFEQLITTAYELTAACVECCIMSVILKIEENNVVSCFAKNK